MSHFAVLVIGEDWESQIAPYDENLKVGFEDETDQMKKDYETKTGSEWHCGSGSSWGQKLTKEIYDEINNSPLGRIITIDILKENQSMGGFFRKGSKYRGYHEVKGEKRMERCEDSVYFEVIKVLETTHPDEDVCFEGKISIQVIESPKDIPFTDMYATFEEYANEWCGMEANDEGRYGYWNNPNSKWDWYSVGGRYRDRLVMKEPELALKGEELERYVGSLYRESEEGRGDIAKMGDIDWEKMHKTKESYDEAIRFWEMKVEGSEPETEEEKERLKYDWYKEGYYEERYGSKEVYAEAMSSFTMWAVVKDGIWYEKGEMGWWGMSDEGHSDAVDWELNFYDRFIKDLPENTLLTVVDCHI